MTLLLLRHAVAVPRGTPGIPDDERPLTLTGRRRFREAARGLTRLVPRPALLLTSPLPRALATAEIAARAWGRVKPTRETALADDGPEPLLALLAAQPSGARVVLVGHEPQLSALLARLLGAPDGGLLTLEKGGAALVELTGAPAGGGRLVWHLPPEVLAALRRA
jgi:phosphohistidine phosphatase